MRIVVFSDSHHNPAALKRIYLVRQHDTDLFIHLGDAQGDIAALQSFAPEIPLVWVRGNCDMRSSGEPEQILNLDGVRIFATHGHLYSVKHNQDALFQRAHEIGADVVLFGHTHEPCCEFKQGIWMVNPGSVAGSSFLRFAVVDISESGTTCYLSTIDR